jgi:hypothetical protein
MRDVMMSMMLAMMPYMQNIMWFGVACIGLGLFFLLIYHVLGVLNNAVKWMGKIALFVGLFFVACHFAGLTLSLTPGINFADASKGQFFIVPFWQIGAALFFPGLMLFLIARRLP